VHDEERATVAELCDQLPALRAEIAQHPITAQQLLAHIETQARTGEPVRALLADLLPTGQAPTNRHLEPLPSLGPGRASEERFGCPNGLCDREATTTPAGPLPRCWLTGRFKKLRSG
jgi:hypothetical protein